MNEELAELIGAFIGDGFYNIYSGHNHFEITGNLKLDKEYLNYLSDICRRNFDVKSILTYREGALRLIIHSKEINGFLSDLGLPNGKKAHKIKIPEKLLNSRYIKNIIRGIFDTDGFVYLDKRKIYKKPYPRMGITTKSKTLFLQIKRVLEQRGFRLYCRIDKKYDIYYLEIYTYEQIYKWMQTIGFSNKKHLDKIASVVQSV